MPSFSYAVADRVFSEIVKAMPRRNQPERTPTMRELQKLVWATWTPEKPRV